MVIKKRYINNEATRHFFYVFIASIMLNLLEFIVPREYIGHLTNLTDLIPILMMVMFLNNLWSAFSMDRLYMYVVPVSKGRIYFDIFIKWVVFYSLAFLVNIICIIVSIDMNYLYENVYFNGLLLDVFQPLYHL